MSGSDKVLKMQDSPIHTLKSYAKLNRGQVLNFKLGTFVTPVTIKDTCTVYFLILDLHVDKDVSSLKSLGKSV